jgi:hypothetical protein
MPPPGVRRGEAAFQVVASGLRTYFGKTAELVRTAKARGGRSQRRPRRIQIANTVFAEPSTVSHQLQPNVRIRVRPAVIAATPYRAAVSWFSGPIRPGPRAPFPRWPVIIAGVSTPNQPPKTVPYDAFL